MNGGQAPAPCAGLLLDLDDTLVNTTESIEVARAATIDALCARRPAFSNERERVRRVLEETTEETWPDAREGRMPECVYQEVRMRRTFEKLGIEDAPLERDLVLVYLDASYRALKLYAEVGQVLPALASSFRLAMVTNGLALVQQRKFLKFSLERHFRAIFIASDFGASKPSASILLAAASRLGLPPAECLVAGDSDDRDVQGAINAGMRSARIHRLSTPPVNPRPADHEYPDLTGLLAHAKR